MRGFRPPTLANQPAMADKEIEFRVARRRGNHQVLPATLHGRLLLPTRNSDIFAMGNRSGARS